MVLPDHPMPEDVERSLLVRQPYARQLVRGLKLVEMRKARHNRVGEVVGIIELPVTPGTTALFVGAVELGRARWVPEADYPAVAEQACSTVDKLKAYGAGRDGLWAWEVWHAMPTEPAVAVPLKSGHQTWVRSDPTMALTSSLDDIVQQAADTITRLTKYVTE